MGKTNIVFDIGNVLIGWHPTLRGVFDADTAAIVEQAVFGSGLWDALDLGVEEEAVIFERMMALAPDYREQVQYILDHLELVSEQHKYTKDWIADLKAKGYGVYFLSNYSRYVRAAQPGLTDFTPLMDGGIFSADVKLVKPDRRIYALLCERYQLAPESCLFVDDRQENVDGAIAYGMQAIRFDGYEQNYEQVMRTLEAMRR